MLARDPATGRTDPAVVAACKGAGLKGPKHFEVRYGRRLQDLTVDRALAVIAGSGERRALPDGPPAADPAYEAAWHTWWRENALRAKGDQDAPPQRGETYGGRSERGEDQQTVGQAERLRFGDLDVLRPAKHRGG